MNWSPRRFAERWDWPPDGALLGADIERMSDAELAQAVEKANVFAKLPPRTRSASYGC